MAKENKTIGRVPVSRHEYTDGATYYKDNIVTRYGSAFQCVVESTTTPPATIDASGKVTLGEGWIFFADASGVADVKNGVAALERDLGQYAELPSVAMTAETTGKYINADGEFVDDADFNIAAIGAVVVGNTYELYMSSAAKMKLGVALFVARIKTTTTSGTERIEYVPLFSAMSTDIPTSGYVCFEAMEAYSDVLVCYRADVPEAATLLVRRYGTKASIATQINNLRKKVDLKSFADGYYESMRVGTADNLTSKGDATEEIIMSRRAGGDNQIEDGSASIKRIKGYSVVFNNKIIMPSGMYGDGVTIQTNSDGSFNINGTALYLAYVHINRRSVHDHLYLGCLENGIIEGNKFILYNDTENGLKFGSQPAILKAIKDGPFIIRIESGQSFDNLKCHAYCYDLTQMFGSGKEPTTPDDFAKRLGYSSINDVPYIPYNEGEIVSSFAEGIKTTDTDGKVSERKWSETLKKYFPDGLKSAGSAYDEITPTKAVKRIETIDLGELHWGYNNESLNKKAFFSIEKFEYEKNGSFDCIVSSDSLFKKPFSPSFWDKSLIIETEVDYNNISELKKALSGVKLCFEYAPEEYTYDELNLTEQVAEGGTEEAIITDGKTSTPLRADIVYPIDAYNTIKANKTNIGTLSSLNTASKTDLVSAINELAGKVGALEAKATEVTNETTE